MGDCKIVHSSQGKKMLPLFLVSGRTPRGVKRTFHLMGQLGHRGLLLAHTLSGCMEVLVGDGFFVQ